MKKVRCLACGYQILNHTGDGAGILGAKPLLDERQNVDQGGGAMLASMGCGRGIAGWGHDASRWRGGVVIHHHLMLQQSQDSHLCRYGA